MKHYLVPICLALTLLCFPLLALAMPLEVRDTVSATMTNQPSQNDDDTHRELFHVAGDVPDPRGTGLRADAPGYNFGLSAIGHPECHYSFGPGGEMPMTIDMYALPGQAMYAIVLCPHCFVRSKATNAIKVNSSHTEMTYDPSGVAANFPGWTDRQMVSQYPRGTGGLLSIGRFRCSWEMDSKREVNRGVEITSNVCDFEVVIDRNIVRRVTRSRTT